MKRIIIFIAACSGAMTAHAGGFELSNQSASAAGVANAVVATANDASALAYNPAGIAWQTGVSVSAGVAINYRNSSVKIPAGVASNHGKAADVAQLYAAWAPLDSRWAAGFGYSPLYQINNEWSNGFPATSGLTKVTVDHLTTDLVYAVNSDLAVGMGADWYMSKVTLTRPGQSFQGKDMASFGGHASLLWKFQPTWSVGAMARTGTSVHMTGQADTLAFKLPDHLTLAVAHDFSDVWRLEGDVKWTRWSALKSMHVRTAGVITQANALNLRDTLTVMVGSTWTWRENVQLRMGYAYDQGANRSRNFNPMVADQDGHRVSLGAGGDLFAMHADLAYQYTYFSKKTATGAYAGNYRDRTQNILFTVSKQFD
ncbi:MAG: outer membrane protein transport protein [Mariprofundus sp.]